MPKDNIERLGTPDTSTIKTPGTAKRKVKGSNRVVRWFREMRSELKKVVWPTPKQIANNTMVALTVMAMAAVAIWALDNVSSQIFRAIITLVPNIPNLFRG